ncbi:cation transporter [Marinicauda algicola]|uniref:Protein p34 n=1 Tax=Marinicauda algicola TaxID=2029849 RepID=A0A4S2H0J6_9PROT|nr:cation diffusion facilitator family transporter [Marinicauda algicola]TGY88934.1 cation transporter [Marinicauda algicola]
MPHDAIEAGGPGKLAPAKAKKITTRVTALSVGVAGTLVAAKLVAWLLSGSVAMLASLADSALDLAASLTTFFAVRYAASPADLEHRYGHGKAEAFASLLQALLVAGSAAYLMWESWNRFTDPQPIEAGTIAVAVMGLSIVLTVGLIWAQSRAVHQTGSLAVTGDRAHYAADLSANGVVIAGLVMAGFFGIQRADPVVGALVALWLLWTAWEVGSSAFQSLMDRELPDEEREKILAIAADDERVLGVHQLRTRASGPFIHIQLHMDLDPDQTLTQAHQIVVAAEKRLLQAYPAADVLIHPDPKGRAEPHGNVYFRAEQKEAAAGHEPDASLEHPLPGATQTPDKPA